ncbi:flagellin [Bradyrhizobium sp. LHD-71]|uniref:flagellin N-terminal helical domain-containing protein n=1 Tax=Bradyrhizobium sp. LHD-71 TaxID=3072141 RepID=UPI00280ECBFA|nr:flagellin [Bradyrhizobium sp. LHD-71]MDQ8732596.1 flagellin [Bradyrhizobium sp. LHD-71]
MSNIVLSASVRQNLLSLQSTADLLATTQSRLATGKKVNTALDNPTNYFTAASLDARASDINNLLDGIGNGVQILQAANTGITSLQKLIDSAKSVANQALQTAVAYSQKSSITAAVIPGATAQNLLGDYTNAARPAGASLKVGAANADASGTTLISALTDGTSTTATGPVNGDTITVNGKTISFVTAGAATFDSNGNMTIGIDQTLNSLLAGIDQITGNTANPSTISGTGQIVLNTGAVADLEISGTALGKLGLAAGTTPRGTELASGLTLTIPATEHGTATNITFGTGLGQVATLNQLNAALAPNFLIASIDTSGRITISTSNDSASETIGTIGGTATATGEAFNGLIAADPVVDPTVQSTRAGLVLQYNKIIENIVTTSQDASFNGVNLLAGDTLKLVFNETGKSVLNIQGVNFTPAGLGLGMLTTGTDFIDNNSTNEVLAALNAAGSSLRSQAASLGSNLSIVQIRQEFSKNLINVLQTGSANLTIADTNEEAANSQALATRQSIAVSALALANQSQQSVLQLLR